VLSLIHTSCNSLQHSLRLLSLLYLHRLSPGNGFQRRSFLSHRVHFLTGWRLSHTKLPGWRPSHTELLFFLLPSQESFVMTAASRYISSARTTWRTPLPTVLLLLHYVAIARTAYRAPFLCCCLRPLPSKAIVYIVIT
jgi:hypothetical protein